MQVLRKYTLECLRLNKIRTLVTVIGITLSMTLLTAVMSAVYSGRSWIYDNEVAENGSWMAQYYDLTDRELADLLEEKDIKDYAISNLIGWAKIGSKNEYKPYLLIQDMDDQFEKLVRINLIEGRLPASPEEILLPVHLSSNGEVYYHLNDRIRLNVGSRQLDGRLLGRKDPYTSASLEEISEPREFSYKVVGFYQRFSYDTEPYSCPGYMALTRAKEVATDSVSTNSLNQEELNSKETDTHENNHENSHENNHENKADRKTIYLTLRSSRSAYQFHSNIQIRHRIEGSVHDNLALMSGSIKDSNFMLMLYGFAAILILIIVIGSVALIYNSFSISITERLRQFGILKSIGASRRQIRQIVFYEAMLLDSLAIPLGFVIGNAGIGVTLYLLKDSFAQAFGGLFSSSFVDIRLKLHPMVFALAAAVCIATTLISAWIPARKVIRLTAIESIRQSRQIRITKRDVKVSPILGRIFGMEGLLAAKNFKRDRSKYRTTIWSLVVSIVLFISASSLTSYLNQSVKGRSGDSGVDLLYYTQAENVEKAEEILKAVKEKASIDEAVYSSGFGFNIQYIPEDLLSKEFLSLPAEILATDGQGGYMSMLSTEFLSEEAYEKLVRDHGLDPSEYLEKEHPNAIIFNHVVTSYRLNNSLAEKSYAYHEFHEKSKGKSFEIKDDRGNFQVTIGDCIEGDEFYRSSSSTPVLIYPIREIFSFPLNQDPTTIDLRYYVKAEEYIKAEEEIENLAQLNGYGGWISNYSKSMQSTRMYVRIIAVFSLGFIILISLIAMSNVFNTMSTNIRIRRREFAMLRSNGMTGKALRKMLNYECLNYGIRSILYGIPLSVLVSYGIFYITRIGYELPFYIPWYSILISVLTVFLLVFATMRYAAGRLLHENLIEALKSDTI